MQGTFGKILRVNLASGKQRTEDVPAQWHEWYVGGRGLGARYLYEEVPAGTDAFAAENKFYVMTGPLNGTVIPSAPRFSAISQSPLNGFYGQANTSGGRFSYYLKQNGVDGIALDGISPSPVILVIRSNAQVACIGPAGENRVRFASIMVEHRALGRCGLGAALGAKHVKAIAVVPGPNEIQVAEPEEVKRLAREFRQALAETEFTAETRRKYGTIHMVRMVNDAGIMPTRNFQKSVFDNIDPLDHLTFVKRWRKRDLACFRCPVACGKSTEVKEGPYAGTGGPGPEWETVWSFGPQCGNDDMAAIIAANGLCHDLGLDTISTGNTIGFALEAFEKGLLKPDASGFRPTWGDTDKMLQLVRMIAERQGLGDLLAEGTKRVSEQIGAEHFAMQVKGMEFPAYDPRGVKGKGLAYATSSRGACHLRVFTIGMELQGLGGGRFSIEGKAQMVKDGQDLRSYYDSSGICYTVTVPIEPKFFAQIMTAVTGIDQTPDGLRRKGEGIYNLERVLGAREGITRKDDTLPERIFTDPVPGGPAEGQVISHAEFDAMLDQYYALRGWDGDTGLPPSNVIGTTYP